MGNMKRLHEAISEAARLSRSQPLNEEELGFLFQSLHEVAVHGNEAVKLLAKQLFSDVQP